MGDLPWQGLKAKNMKEKYEKIMEKKISTPIEVLCKNFPEEIQIFIHYTRDLRFDDRPDYGFLKKLLKTIVDREKFEIDYMFDWVIRKQENEKMKEESKDDTKMGEGDKSNIKTDKMMTDDKKLK